MATQDRTGGGSAPSLVDAQRVRFIRRKIDFSATTAENADVIQALNIPANTLVLRAGTIVRTAEGSALTATLGDGSDADGFVTSVDLNAVEVKSSALALTEGTPNTVTGYSGGKLYTADDTIDLVLGGAAAAAIVEVWAMVVDLT